MGQSIAGSVWLIVAFWCSCVTVQAVQPHPLARPYVVLKTGDELLGGRCVTAAADEAPAKPLAVLRLRPSVPEDMDYGDYAAAATRAADYVDDDDWAEVDQQQIQRLLQTGKFQLVEVRQDSVQDGAESAEVMTDSHDEDNDASIDDADNDDDERTSQKRPWRKVKRILQRQLIKKPKRYLKKLIRKVGLKRQLRSHTFTLVPLETSAVQEVGILVHDDPVAKKAAAKEPIDVEGVFLLQPTD